MNPKYDLVVIGSGPGGYVAAIRAAQLGLKTALVEKYNTLGGTCLNVGCIPSKALLDSSEHFYNALHHFKTHGIEVTDLKVNLEQMMQRKREVVSKTCQGVAFLMKKNKVDVYHGVGSFESRHQIKVTPSSGEVILLHTDKVIIATGSKPTILPGIPYDKKRFITSTEALELKEIPQHLIIIGGGVIGTEIGSIYGRMGAKVTVIEYTDSLIPSMDRTLGKELQKVLIKLGFTFYFNHQVTGGHLDNDQVVITAQDEKGQTVTFQGDYCLLATGRRPYTEGLQLQKVGVQLDSKGRVEVNQHLETNVKGIYAIGDVIGGQMLAHKAEEEGIFVAETIAGQKPHVNYLLIPGVVYTWPEVAGVGYTEEDLKNNGRKYKVGMFPYKALGRARASMDTDGLVKVLADAQTDELLGVHIIGARAADMIMEAVVAMEYRASAEDIARMSHAHPTFSEAIKEACLAATENRAIHV
ncbi:MAG: dihydrolipoyl dehydrogenase [Cytophagales bacterium]|nr:dihydrolipoyl dehydrogenase [Bernardetiaceae bacterium]MDW8211094.1 dihydrolipoyl dehydrogenase [Cytophagales bacterium]